MPTNGCRLEGIIGLYMPCWTFDANAASKWKAEAGFHYQVEEEYTATEDGEKVTSVRSTDLTRQAVAAASTSRPPALSRRTSASRPGVLHDGHERATGR